jgi:hypothetical protein
MSGNRFDHYGAGEAAAPPQRDWSDVPGEAWRNAPRSGADQVENLAYPLARVAGSIPGRVVSLVGEPIVSNTLGVVTRKGADAVRAAGRAGVEANNMLPAHMSGLAPIEDVQGMATSALDKARQEALAAYSNDAASVTADKRPFDFQPIEVDLPDPATARTFDGIDLTDIPRLRTRLDEIIGEAKASDPTAQTPQRMDELKRAVAALRAWNLPRSPERAAVDRVHAAIEAEIADNAPNYAKAMADHWKAADQLDGVNDSLRVQNDDAAIRKLQAMSRINVATSDGQRATLMDILARHEPALPYALAGQAMKGSESSGLPARLLGLAHLALPFLAVPRLVGEGASGGGSMMRRAGEMGVTPERTSAVLSGAYQTGRAAGGATLSAPGLRVFGGNSSADPESSQLAAARALRTANERLAAGRR